jgi:hypothetical protein
VGTLKKGLNLLKLYKSFQPISEGDILKSAVSNEHISKTSLWHPGMQKSARYWVQYWNFPGIRQAFRSSFFTNLISCSISYFHTSQAVFGNVISEIKAAVAPRHSFISIPVS